MIEKNAVGLYEAECDGQLYEFQKWGAEDSFKTLMRVAAIIAEPIGQVAGDLLSKKDVDLKDLMDLNLDGDMVSKAVRALCLNLNADNSFALMKKFCTDRVMCEGKQIKFDHFDDRLDHAFKVLKLAVEVQYGNFFGAVAGMLRTVPAKKNRPVPLTSTG